MERMHHEDLRALVAALMCQGVHALTESWETASIKDADALLAELDRTAKPEPPDPLNPRASIRRALEKQENHPGWMDRIKRERMKAYDEGALAERERITALLDKDGANQLILRNGGTDLFGDCLRDVLTPTVKP